MLPPWPLGPIHTSSSTCHVLCLETGAHCYWPALPLPPACSLPILPSLSSSGPLLLYPEDHHARSSPPLCPAPWLWKRGVQTPALQGQSPSDSLPSFWWLFSLRAFFIPCWSFVFYICSLAERMLVTTGLPKNSCALVPAASLGICAQSSLVWETGHSAPSLRA